jgi:hypothetical protein
MPIWRCWELKQTVVAETACRPGGSLGDVPLGLKRKSSFVGRLVQCLKGALVVRDGDGRPQQAVLGSFSFSTDGLGITPGNPLSLIQASETPEESKLLSQWFDAHWSGLQTLSSQKKGRIDRCPQ